MPRHTDPNWPYTDDPAGGRPSGADPTQIAAPPEYYDAEHDTLLFDGAPPDPDPAPTERDRIWVHLLWEAALLLALVGVVVAILSTRGPDEFRTPTVDALALTVAVLLLVTSALAWSLRAGVPNLAVGTVAAGAPLFSRWLVAELDLPGSALAWVAFPAALAVGVVLAVVAVGFHVPAWAASLGVTVVLVGLYAAVADRQIGLGDEAAPELGVRGLIVFGAAAAISVLGSALWTIPRLRWSWGASRTERDPAHRPAPAGRVGALVALIGSMLLAAAAGVLLTLGELPDDQGAYALEADDGYVLAGGLTAFALAAALLGGVSAYGRRAGVFGTALGVLLLALFLEALPRDLADHWLVVVLGGAILVGLVVNRGLETAGRQPVVAPLE